MNMSSTKRAGIIVSVCWMVVMTVFQQTAFGLRNLKAGDTLPAFSLIRADGKGQQYNSQQLTGQPAVIVFWRPNQKRSFEALGDLQSLVDEIGAARFKVLAVDTRRSSVQTIQAALGGKTLSFPVLLDPQRTLYGTVGVIVSPTTLLLDAKGVLRFVVASHPPQFRHVIRARLRFLLGQIDRQTMDQQIKPTVLKIEHDLAAAWRMFNLGKKLQAEGKSSQAIDVYQKVVSQRPTLTEARCALGFLKLEAGDVSAAAQNFQTALTYAPNSPVAHLGQAAVMARTDNADRAEQILLSLLSHRSIAIRVRYELGRIYHTRGELDKAVTFYQDALATMFPESTGPGTAGSVEIRFKTPPTPATAPSSPPASTIKEQTHTAVTPVTPPSDARYLGVKRCKKCHLQQWKSWKKTKMAATFDVLKPGAASDEKQKRQLDPQKDYTADPQCLRCHTNGFNLPGGYRIPPAGDAKAARVAKANAGIGCESCHGPGSKYSPIHKDIQDKKRQYAEGELYNVGQYKVDSTVCAVCHTAKAPCIEPGYVFDFEKRKEKGTHKHFDLQFRAK